MPELPEVETVVRDLKKKIIGRRIMSVDAPAPSIIKNATPSVLAKALKGARITEVRRRGKNILIFLNTSYVLLVHMKMTGHLLYGRWRKYKGEWTSRQAGELSERVNQYIRLLFILDNGFHLALSDVRKFAKVLLVRKENLPALPDLQLGPEPLDKALTPGILHGRLAKGRRAVKLALLDQKVLAGIGNIYADDILWSARVHPRREAASLTNEEVKKILKAMRIILPRAIKARGASMITYRDTAGKRGGYGLIRLVYHRHGEPCPRCRTAIERIQFGGRSSHFCPACQVV